MSETTQSTQPTQPKTWSLEWLAIQVAGNEQDVQAKYDAWRSAQGALNLLQQMYALKQQEALDEERARLAAEAEAAVVVMDDADTAQVYGTAAPVENYSSTEDGTPVPGRVSGIGISDGS